MSQPMRQPYLFEPAVEAAEIRRARFEMASLLSLGLGVAFLGTGIAKIAAMDFVLSTFQGWNAPLWVLAAIGVFELTAAVLTLIPTTRLVGAGTIAAVMVGAAGYHAVRGEVLMIAVPVTALIVALSVIGLELSLRKEPALQPIAAR